MFKNGENKNGEVSEREKGSAETIEGHGVSSRRVVDVHLSGYCSFRVRGVFFRFFSTAKGVELGWGGVEQQGGKGVQEGTEREMVEGLVWAKKHPAHRSP